MLLAATLWACAGVAAAATYDGQLTLPARRLAGATAALDVTVGQVTGTITLIVGDAGASGVYELVGRQRGFRMTVTGTSGAGGRLRWKGRQRGAGLLDGPARVRAPGVRLRGRLTLIPRAAGATACDDYFRGEVMSRVLVPVCAACHVAGGTAGATRLQVSTGDPAATQAATLLLIDKATPSASRLLQKPVGLLAHGGGSPLTPGGPEMQVLQGWVDRVALGACDGSTAPGGGGGGGDPGAQRYVEHCASCHGTDTLGVGGRPRLRCNRDVADAVKMGREGATPETTMPPFPRLTDTDIGLIQGFLDGLCPPATATGADLFAGNCATCHGTDARGGSGPDVHCGRSIHDAIRNGLIGVFGKMPAMLRITDPEILRLQDHLLALCPVGTASGAALFTSNCASCHGTDGEGFTTRPDIRCAAPSRVADAVRDGRGFTFPVMPSFGTSALTDAELASVRGFLAARCSGTPAALFAANCATCHGATGSGGQNANQVAGPNIRCSSSADVFDAVVDGTGGMPAIADLTTGQINAIVTFVRSGCP